MVIYQWQFIAEVISCLRFGFTVRVITFSVVCLLCIPAGLKADEVKPGTYRSSDGLVVVENPFSRCSGQCGLHLFAGTFLDTHMTDVFGVDGYTAPWKWTYGSSKIAGAAVSRRLMTAFDAISIEGEVGLAQRFGGNTSATEVWGAFYARWHKFPWNDYLYTTIAVSTGLNYASKVDQVEREKSPMATSKLLHYLSPEITFALPQRKDWNLVVRLHHRSGGRDYVLGNNSIFNGVAGGAQYLTLGVRKYF